MRFPLRLGSSGVVLALVSLSVVGVGCRPTAPIRSVVAIGNSMVTHPPAESLGWTGNWGMAAPTPAADFVHLTAKRLGISKVMALNVSGLEAQPGNYSASAGQVAKLIQADSLVVVKLGENVAAANHEAFGLAYSKLLDEASKGAALVCISTYWKNPPLDDIMRSACSAHAGKWVYVGDVFGDPGNVDRRSVEYANGSVNDHPRAWGMKMMAQRVLDVL